MNINEQQRVLVQPWHNPTADNELRRDIIREVVRKLLKFTQIRFVGDNRPILTESARQIEHALYRNTSTRVEYENISTLEARMRPLVEMQFNRGILPRPPSNTNSASVDDHTVPLLALVNLDESTANSVHDTRNDRPDHEILMYMLHAQRCTQTDQCNLIHLYDLDCKALKRFVQHILTCSNALTNECQCVKFRSMLAHFARCTNKESCSTCQLHYAVVVLKGNFQREDEFQEKMNTANGATVKDENKLGEFQQEIDKCRLVRQGIVHHVYFDVCRGDVILARRFCLFSLEDLVSHPKNADRILEIDKMLTNSKISFQREIEHEHEEQNRRSSVKRSLDVRECEEEDRLSTKCIKIDEKEQIVTEEPCGVCLETEFTEVGALDCCEHKFCYSCIEQWSKRCNTCPLCKRRFRLSKLLDSKTNLCKSTSMIRETILIAVPPR
jgi:TAZ zinc finger/Ring finger domain